jgi:Fe-S oxidoreductase
MHIVFLDNGRSTLARDPVFSQVLRCVRCGACANVCPIYKLVGGKAYGHIYIGAIGLILTYFYHGREKDKHLIQNCLSCQACKEVCIAGIDLPRLIEEVRILVQKDKKTPLFNMLACHILSNRKLFHSLLRTARFAQSTPTRDKPSYRHLPEFIFKKHNFKSLPSLAPKPFRDLWPELKSSPSQPQYKVALFSGCLQDFVYPEQLKAGVEFLIENRVQVEFPMEQGCCGLPVQMLGEKRTAAEIALHNLACFDPEEYDFILTLCASCASHLKHNYPAILQDHSNKRTIAEQFSEKIVDFSSFVYKHLQALEIPSRAPAKTFAYHAPCHLCRSLGVRQAPKELLQKAGLSYVPTSDEESCCGLGGTYSLKFPEISKEILYNKLEQIEKSGAELLLTDCPGCILQLRGGAHKTNKSFQVKHTAEILSFLK